MLYRIKSNNLRSKHVTKKMQLNNNIIKLISYKINDCANAV